MTRILETLFAWPDGIVVGNLIASALWSIPAWGIVLWRLETHHREHMAALGRLGAR